MRLQHPVPTTGALSLKPAACETYLSMAANMAVSNQQATKSPTPPDVLDTGSRPPPPPRRKELQRVHARHKARKHKRHHTAAQPNHNNIWA